MGNCFYQVFRNGTEKFISQHAQPTGGHWEDHSTGSPQCIIDYIETKPTKLSAYQQAQSEHSIEGYYNSFIFLIRVSSNNMYKKT